MSINSTIDLRSFAGSFADNYKHDCAHIMSEFSEAKSSLTQELQDKIAINEEDKNFLNRISKSNIKSDSRCIINDIVTISRACQFMNLHKTEEGFNALRDLLKKKLESTAYKIKLKNYYAYTDRVLFYDLVNDYMYDKLPPVYSLIISKRYQGKNYNHELGNNLKYYPSSKSFAYKLHLVLRKSILCFCIWHCCGCESEYYVRDCGGGYIFVPEAVYMDSNGDIRDNSNYDD